MPNTYFLKRTIRERFKAWLAFLLVLLWSNGSIIVRAQENVWTHIGPNGAPVRKIALDHSNPATIYTGTTNLGVLKSTDSGTSWTSVNSDLTSIDVLSLALDPQNSNTVYVSTNDHGLFKSTDGGASWTAIKEGLPADYAVTTIVIDQSNPLTLYVGTTGDCDFFFCKGQVFKSVDGGRRWDATGVSGPDSGISALAMDSKNPKTLYAASGEFGDLYKSTDAGTSWGGISFDFLFSTIVTIAIDPVNPSALYVGTVGLVIRPSESWVSKGIFKSTDGGASWIETTAGLGDFNIEDIAIDPASPGTLYAATDTGVFRSGNGGKNWSELNKGLGEGFVLDLAIAPTDPATVYAGTFGGGLFAIQPVGPVPPPVLRITGAFVYRGKLYVFGDKFEEGAKILLNGEKEKTRNAFYNPTATLIGRRAGNKIVRGQTVTLQVRNPDGTLSPEFTFTR
jgi:photosystem II stability/assembly factor-like uncharacterized protein